MKKWIKKLKRLRGIAFFLLILTFLYGYLTNNYLVMEIYFIVYLICFYAGNWFLEKIHQLIEKLRRRL